MSDGEERWVKEIQIPLTPDHVRLMWRLVCLIRGETVDPDEAFQLIIEASMAMGLDDDTDAIYTLVKMPPAN